MTANSKKNSKRLKTIKNEIDDIESSKNLLDLQNIQKNNYENNLVNLPPVIPVGNSSNGLVPPFNIRVQLTNNLPLIKETIYLNKVKGTTSDSHLIDSEFRPKREFINKRFRKVWKWIQCNPNNEEHVIFPSNIILVKITDDDYYVVQGLRRVVTLKHSNIKTISALIVDYRDVYNKIVERREKIELQKKQQKNDIIYSNSSFKPMKPRIRPTPILKGQPRK
jgi:hypothetical protein